MKSLGCEGFGKRLESRVPRETLAIVRLELSESELFRGIVRLGPKALENLALQLPNAFVVDEIRVSELRRTGKQVRIIEKLPPRHADPIGRSARVNIERLKK